MKNKEKITCWILTFLIAAYLILMPGYFVNTRKYVELQTKVENTESFTGLITLWHIVRFKPYQGSMGAWLGGLALKFEDAHRGVYLEVFTMTEKECAARLARGERADAYSFPAGWGDPDQFTDGISVRADYLGNLGRTGMWEGERLAVPIGMSGYVLLINESILQSKGIQVDEKTPIDTLSGYAADLTYVYGKKKYKMYGMSGSPVIAAVMGLRTEVAVYDEFLEKDAAMALADLGAAGNLERQLGAGKGFAFDAFPVGTYTDLVQYVGIDQNTEEAKKSYLNEFFSMILQEETQKGLLKMGILPVSHVNGAECDIKCVGAVWEQLLNPVAPNAFLYQRYEDELLASATRLLTGDESGAANFKARLKELVEFKG